MKLYKEEGIYFLWFTILAKDYCILWELDFENLWWVPKLIQEKKCWHVGWLFFQVGAGVGGP